jgi:hypothetical protein
MTPESFRRSEPDEMDPRIIGNQIPRTPSPEAQAVETLRKLTALQNSTIPDILEAALKEKDERIAAEQHGKQTLIIRLDQAKAEVERLREALEGLLRQMERGEIAVRSEEWYLAREKAHAALANDESGERE